MQLDVSDIIAAAMGIVNVLWAFMVRGVKAEIKAMRGELDLKLIEVTTKIDLHVIDRITRTEHELAELRVWRREVDHSLARTERRREDRQGS